MQNLKKNGFAGILRFSPWLCDNQSKFQSYSTNLHTQAYHFGREKFLENFPVFQKNLHCVQNLNNNGFAGILRFYPLIMWQSIKISVLFHKSTHRTLPFWLKRIFGKFPSFPEKLTLRANFGQKWYCWDFKVWPPHYVTINQNFSPIPHICTPNITILTKKNFWKVSQFSRKTYIVCKIWPKMVLMGFWGFTPWLCDNQSKFQSYSTNLHTQAYHFGREKFLENFPVFQKNLHCVQNLNNNGFAGILRFYPLIMWQSIKISVLFHKSTHRTLPFWLKRIFGKFPSFPEKLTLRANFGQKWYCWDFKVWPPHYVTINQNFSPIPHICTPNTTILTKKNFWKVSQFSRKTYIVCKIWPKMVFLGFWGFTPWLCDNQSKF